MNIFRKEIKIIRIIFPKIDVVLKHVISDLIILIIPISFRKN